MSDNLSTLHILNASLQEALKFINSCLNMLKKSNRSAVQSLTELEKEVKGVLNVLGLLSTLAYSEFLKNKFIQDLEDAEEEHSGENEIPLRSHFLKIRGVLEAKDITKSTPIKLKHCLYDAIIALEDCVVLSEKRQPRKKKDGPMHGYTLAELWFIRKSRKLLVKITRKLTAAIPGMADMAATSSSTSLPLISRLNPVNFRPHSFPGFDEQVKTILDRLRNRGEGFQEIGIVGIGGSGKTTLAQLTFVNEEVIDGSDYRIWICLFRELSGDVDFKKMIKDMLEQCRPWAVVDDGVEVEEEALLEILGNVLKGKRYLMVLDGIWDINIHWYFKLRDKLKCVKGDGDGHIIITSRLPHNARMMVGPHNLYHMQPPSTSIEKLDAVSARVLDALQEYKSKLKDEVIERCDGLPLAMKALAKVIEEQILRAFGGLWLWRSSDDLIVLINVEDDAMLGNEVLSSWRIVAFDRDLVMDVSKVLLHDVFNKLNQHLSSLAMRGGRVLDIVVYSGDAMANQLMQLITRALRNAELRYSFVLLPLGSKANISFSLGWVENQPHGTLPKDMVQFFYAVTDKPSRPCIDSWGIVMKMKSIPEGFQLPSTFGLESALKANLQPMEGDREFHATFWNYFIIGLDADESLQKKDECCSSCYFKAWPRNIVLPISIKTKDEQGEWKEISIPHSTRSIICLNLPCFPNRPNVKKKYRNFKDPFVDDGLLEVICFRDAWHGDDFLPSKDRGECLAQVGSIQFKPYNNVVNHIHMSIDGNRWKHTLPIEDNSMVIELYHSGKTSVYANSNSKCKFKAPE